MDYDLISQMLIERDIFPKKDVFVDEMEERHVKALRVYCPPILKDKKLSYVREIVGGFARVYFLQDEIIIEL